MKFGYIKMSSLYDNCKILESLVSLGVEKKFVFIEDDINNRFNHSQYQNVKEFLRSGDIIFIDTLNSLGRYYRGILIEWKEITQKINADIVILENQILFDSRKFKNMGDIGKNLEEQFLSMFDYFAEQQYRKNKIRQAEGIKAAVEKGIKFGRSKKEIDDNFKAIYGDWIQGKIKSVEAMAILDMKRNTFYRRVKEYKAQCDK